MSDPNSWATVRVTGIYVDADGTRLAGSITTSIDTRLTNSKDKSVIVPAGRIPSACKRLNTNPNLGDSIDITLPSTDDPDILEKGWKIVIRVTFCEHRQAETYVLDDLKSGQTYDLSEFVPIDSILAQSLDPSVHIIQGPAGTSITSISDPDGDGVATVTMSDGSTMDLKLPRGFKGDDGKSIVGMSQDGPDVVVTYSDGSTTKFVISSDDSRLRALETTLPTKQDLLTFDTTPTAGSSNPVTSDGINTAFVNHIQNAEPHPAYDDMADLSLLYKASSS